MRSGCSCDDVAQAGAAGAGVVDGEPHARRRADRRALSAAPRRRSTGGVLGDLDDDPGRVVGRQQVAEARARDGLGREVDRDEAGARERAGASAAVLQLERGAQADAARPRRTTGRARRRRRRSDSAPRSRPPAPCRASTMGCRSTARPVPSSTPAIRRRTARRSVAGPLLQLGQQRGQQLRGPRGRASPRSGRATALVQQSIPVTPPSRRAPGRRRTPRCRGRGSRAGRGCAGRAARRARRAGRRPSRTRTQYERASVVPAARHGRGAAGSAPPAGRPAPAASGATPRPRPCRAGCGRGRGPAARTRRRAWTAPEQAQRLPGSVMTLEERTYTLRDKPGRRRPDGAPRGAVWGE